MEPEESNIKESIRTRGSVKKVVPKTTTFKSTLIEFLESNLEREFRLALGLSPDDEGEEETRHENDAEGYEVPHSRASLHCQHTEHQDQPSCRRIFIFILFHAYNSAQVLCNFTFNTQ